MKAFTIGETMSHSIQGQLAETNTGTTKHRDRTAKYVMIVLGISTLGAFANAVYQFGSMPSDRIVAHSWEMLAYPVFAGIFTLLGLFPRRMPGLWELLLFHKISFTLISIYLIGSAAGSVASDDPSSRVVIDGVLIALTILSYVLAKGWRAWIDAR